VGLDTVALIESHYVEERGLSPAKTVDFLNTHYITDGKLGTKSSYGGLYPPAPVGENKLLTPSVLVLDIGLSCATPTMASGSMLEYSTTGQLKRTLVKDQALPDGISVDKDSGLIFWTNMGVPGKQDGAVLSLNLNTMAIQTIVAPGTINTPKQLALDNVAKKIYFCDREGCRVYRCNFDGSDLETLISTGNPENPDPAQNVDNWCVGVAVAPTLGKFFWTQKGPSKGGQGRIFCADISTPAGQSATSRSDVECILKGLPEPIDLEVDETSNSLYWTDRGEIPFGNSLNRARLDASGQPVEKHEVLTRNLNEAIGLKIDASNNTIYLTDLGGSIYRCDLEGKNKSVLASDDHRAFTGITLL
jgi:DNA-binding beta-propeller fold protein YncE